MPKPVPNKAMVANARYEIRYRNPMHRRDRLERLPMDWVISLKRVDKSTPIAINRLAPVPRIRERSPMTGKIV